MDYTLACALGYARRGFAVQWARPRSKVPNRTQWSTQDVATSEALQHSYRPGYNVSLRCGRWSQTHPGQGFIVVDIDIKDDTYHPEPFEVLGRFYDGPIVDVLSGSGIGRHWWFTCPLDMLPTKANTVLAQSPIKVEGLPAWTIEVLSTGKCLVAPPSIHPSGKAYRFLDSADALPPLPESILEALALHNYSIPAPRPALPSLAPSRDTGVAERFKGLSWHEILAPYGWTYAGDHGERQHWCRPGKTKRDGMSATTIGDVFYCFSSSTTFETERGYSKFHTYAILAHNGDMSRASAYLKGATNGA